MGGSQPLHAVSPSGVVHVVNEREYVLPRLPSSATLRPDVEVRVLTSTAPADFERDDIDAAIRLGPLPGKRYSPNQPRIPHELARNWRDLAAFELWDEVLTPGAQSSTART